MSAVPPSVQFLDGVAEISESASENEGDNALSAERVDPTTGGDNG